MSFRPKELLAEARLLEKSGKVREAAALYTRLSTHLRKRRKGAEALSLVSHAISLVSNSPRLFLQRALCESFMGKMDAAAASMHEFTRRAMERGQTEKYRDYLEVEAADFPRLRAIYYEAVLKIDRTHSTLLVVLAKARMESEEYELAKQCLLDAIRMNETGIEFIDLCKQYLQRVGQEDLLDALGRYQRGELSGKDFGLLLRGGPAPEKEVSQSQASLRNFSEPSLQEMIQGLEQKLGIPLEEKRDTIGDLLEEFRRKADPLISDDGKARIDLALAFFEMGLHAEAKQELKKVAYTNPHFHQAKLFLGQVLSAEGSDLEALEVLHECLRDGQLSATEWCEVSYQLAQVYRKLGDIRRSLEQIDRIAEKEPSYRDIREIRRHLMDHLERRKATGT